jgi:hypothetical protein
LESEIALARCLLERSADSPAAIPLLTTIGKLSQASLSNRIKMGQLMDRRQVVRLAQRICAIVDEELTGVAGKEDILQRIGDRISAGIEEECTPEEGNHG